MSLESVLDLVLTALGFGLFFGGAAVAIMFREHELVRKGFVVLFLLLLVAPNVGAPIRWPFLHWGLFAAPGPTDQVGYEWRVVDDAGNELRYDNQAAEPVLVLERYGPRVITRDEEYTRSLGVHLIKAAKRYRETVEGGGTSHPWWAFPEHQIRPHWTAQDFEEFGPIVAVALYCERAQIAENGSRVLSTETSRVATINRTTVTVDRGAC